MSNDENVLVTLAEMASRLRLQPQELRREAEEGRLPAVRVGLKSLLFDPAVVDRLLRERAAKEAHQGGQADHES